MTRRTFAQVIAACVALPATMLAIFKPRARAPAPEPETLVHFAGGDIPRGHIQPGRLRLTTTWANVTCPECRLWNRFTPIPQYTVPVAPVYALIRYRDRKTKSDIWRLHAYDPDGREYGLESVITDEDRRALIRTGTAWARNEWSYQYRGRAKELLGVWHGDDLDLDAHRILLDMMNDNARKRGAELLTTCHVMIG